MRLIFGSKFKPGKLTRFTFRRLLQALALLLVASFAVYHGILHFTYGVTPCKGLLKDGMYKGASWQPWGCMMHKYTQT